ncbi:ribose-phosphate pyrophosphokinase [bacterium]|nr:ribose-phosphate pyrophosphokinase [bacterium]MCI0604633.1 ribose-phosphate pyrophosphokinase [bacterium]
MDRCKIFSGNANPELAEEVCENMSLLLGKSHLTRFSDGESYFQILENVRGVDVFIIQPTCSPVNTNLMELLIMIDAFRRSSAGRITAVIPYYGYARQDRKDKPRVPITARLAADLIARAGADRVLTMDLHANQIVGFFAIPVDHLYAAPVLLKYISDQKLPNLTIVSPDAGGVERARAFAVRLDAQLAIVDKRRVGPNVAETMNVIGDVKGRTCVIVDDMIDTAGTLTSTSKSLKDQGAERILATCSHGVLSGPAIERIENSSIEKVLVTNTIPLRPEAQRSEKFVRLSVAELLARAIINIHKETSVSELFV